MTSSTDLPTHQNKPKLPILGGLNRVDVLGRRIGSFVPPLRQFSGRFIPFGPRDAGMRFLSYEKPGETVKLKEARNLFGNPMHGAHLDFYPEYQTHPTLLYRIPGGLYHCQDHVAFTPDYEVVDWHLPYWFLTQNCPHTLYRGRLGPPKRLQGKVLMISAAGASGNLWHTLFDSIPKICIAREAGFHAKDFSAVCINRADRHYERESLKACGFTEDQILVTDELQLVQADELFYVNLGYLHIAQRWAIDFLREIFGEELRDQMGRNRVIISRERASFRKLVEEKHLLNELQADGFELIRLEELTFREQIRRIANSEIVLSPHGAGLSNLAWARPGSTCIELLAPEYMNICYWLMSEICGLNYRYAIGDPIRGEPSHQRGVASVERNHANIVFSDLQRLVGAIRGEIGHQF